MADNSITLAGDLGQPASRLIDKVSEAIGGIAKPWQAKRMAKAETEAELIRAEGRLKISELERRGLERLVREEGQKQENIERIVEAAAERLEADAKPEELDDDWIRHFFESCRLTSDSDMQKIWAKILSGQANTPGSFSRRTVNMLSSLDKIDANLFSELSSFVVDEGRTLIAIYDLEAAALATRGINFKALTELESIGLIKLDHTAGFILQQNTTDLQVIYGPTIIQITLPVSANNKVDIGLVMLTESGRQLMKIVDPSYDEDVLVYLESIWNTKGWNPRRIRTS